MLIAVLILSVVVLIEGYIIVEREGRIIYLRKRLLRQIRMTDALKSKLQSRKEFGSIKTNTLKAGEQKNIIVHPVCGQTEDEILKRLEAANMPIEMTEVKNEEK